MAKAKLKTHLKKGDPKEFVATLKDSAQKADSLALMKLMAQASGEKPKMWGSAIIGYGYRVLKYASGRELDWFYVGFSPRKGSFSLYNLDHDEKLLPKLGKVTHGSGCIYFKKLSDLDTGVLKKMIVTSIKRMKKTGEF
jgi:hypothetical protein